MDPDEVAPTLDLRTVLDALSESASSAARSFDDGPTGPSSRELEPLLRYLDVEERVVFDRADRALDDGPELTADGRSRHRQLLRAMERGEVAAVQDALATHVEAQHRTLYARLLHVLDADDRRDLAAAIEEARLSREEFDEVPPMRLEP